MGDYLRHENDCLFFRLSSYSGYMCHSMAFFARTQSACFGRFEGGFVISSSAACVGMITFTGFGYIYGDRFGCFLFGFLFCRLLFLGFFLSLASTCTTFWIETGFVVLTGCTWTGAMMLSISIRQRDTILLFNRFIKNSSL